MSPGMVCTSSAWERENLPQLGVIHGCSGSAGHDRDERAGRPN